ncbi:family 20 glycosylhydrolase [Pedobacter sp. HMF7647]|uniref:beta-N-acetylhexosaminidase n=1 Tax=Hufsiella arboris TaxID=2695275 RepID=A0A7K1Y534_9SPHI|nr:glycoside hydrolase family 20 protein [Hufsiella arboris]MXV49694.1 family 20 glycosylhydrolase [Hufsiella arboris]
MIKLVSKVLFVFLSSQYCFGQASKSLLSVIPQPVSITVGSGSFTINRSTVINLQPGVNRQSLVFFQRYVESYAGYSLTVSNAFSGKNVISLRIDSNLAAQKEGYRLTVTPQLIELTGHDEAGVFYGLQTLIQLIHVSTNKMVSVPGCSITDYPRFSYRGMHLDVSRNMFPVSAIKKWIDVLALYKINTFHWHLTDDQGWRIEIKRFPKLQTISAYRDETLIGHKKELPRQFDGKRYGGYYTQEDAREIVRYAKERHITVIPEIEMPGHASAALTAYPNLGCNGGPYQTAKFWGIFDDVFCAGNDDTFNFLEQVLDEVIAIFPSEYIHIGGDECPKTRWKSCPKCQKRISDQHLKDEHELQSYFIQRISNYLLSKNRKIIGWDEIREGGLTTGATVMSWTGEEGGIAAARLKHDVVMTPEKYVYLDYYQSLNPNEPLAAGGYLPLSKIYSYEPVPAVLSSEDAKYIKGVQANVWTEYMSTIEHAEYMIFPRLLALAELGWTSKANRSLPDFLKRVRVNEPLLKKLAVNYSTNYDEITDSIIQSPNNIPLVKLQSTSPNAEIHYTLDGSEPAIESAIYQIPVKIAESCILKASLFEGGLKVQRAYQRQFVIHKATGKPVKLKYEASGNFNPGNTLALTNGVSGTNRYNDSQWYGFSGSDFEAVVDLGTIQPVTLVGTNILKYHWQKMWEPSELVFYLSQDGKDYKPVYRQKEFPVNGINKIRSTIPATEARFVKVRAVNKGIIPEGEYGAGGKAWLLVDELIVN